MRLFIFAISMALLCAMMMSCSNSDSPSVHTGSGFTLKMHQNTGENPFAQLAYQCDECSFEQFAAIAPPGEIRSLPAFDGVPSTVDFVPEIPGNEMVVKASDIATALTIRAVVSTVWKQR